MERKEAISLLKKYNQEEFHLRHAFSVEGVMRYFAEKNGEDEEFWGPEHQMEKILFAVDELTGLIWVAAKMRPSKSTKDMEVSSLKKKFKDKKFAAGCSREIIKQGAEQLGWDLDELFEKTILAMRVCENKVEEEMKAIQ